MFLMINFVILMQSNGNNFLPTGLVNIWGSLQSWRRVGAKLYYRRQKDVNFTSQCEYSNEIVTVASMLYFKVNLLSNVEATLVQRCKFEVVIPILWFPCCSNVAHTTVILFCMLNVDATLEQSRNFDVVSLKTQQLCGYNGVTALPPILYLLGRICIQDWPEQIFFIEYMA